MVRSRIIFHFLFALTIVTASVSATSAQMGGNGEVAVRNFAEIRGDVRSKETGQPLIDVLVRCSGTGGISDYVTTRDGKFYFRVSPGNYTITVQASGYESAEQSTTLTDIHGSDYMPFRLKPDLGGPRKLSTSSIDANVPPEARKEFEKAEAAMALGKKESVEEAIGHYQKSLSLYPKFTEAQLKLGTAYMDLGDWGKAEDNLKKSLELDPKAANAMFALGEVYLRQKKNEEAEKVLTEGLKIEERSDEGHLTLSRVYLDMSSKAKDEALARPLMEKSYNEVNKALKYNANLAQAHIVKGNLLLKVRRAADAQHEFEEYLRLEPKGPFADQARTVVEKIKKALESEKKP